MKCTRVFYLSILVLTSFGLVSGCELFERDEDAIIHNTPHDQESLNADVKSLTIDTILNGNKSKSAIVSDLLLPTKGEHGSTIVWLSSQLDIISNDGKVSRPQSEEGNKNVVLTATLSLGSFSDSVPFDLTVLQLPATDIDIVAEARRIVSEKMLGDNPSLARITTNLNLPANHHEVSILWDSSEKNIVSDKGEVTRPEFGDGNANLTLTATFTLNDASETKTFELTVLKSPQTDDAAVEAAKTRITSDLIKSSNPSLAAVVADLNLIVSAENGVMVSWESSNEEVIESSGSVSRPEYGMGNMTVELVATLSKGEASDTTSFQVTVLEIPQTDKAAVAEAKSLIDHQLMKLENSSLTEVVGDLNLVNTIGNGVAVSWSSAHTNIIALSGSVTRPEYGMGNMTVELVATLSKGEASDTVSVQVTVLEMPQTDEAAVAEATGMLDFDLIKGTNTELLGIISNLNLPGVLGNGVAISWTSSEEGVISLAGNVTRPAFDSDDVNVTLEAHLTKGEAQSSRPFHLKVLRKPASAAEAVDYVIQYLSQELVKGINSSLDSVMRDLNLPGTGAYGVSISWSSDSGFLAISGSVTRPNFNEGNVIVNLTALVEKGDVSQEKVFEVTIIALPPSPLEAIQADILGLIETLDVTTEVVTDLILPITGPNGTSIAWQSSIESIISGSGAVTLPSFENGDVTVVLTAIVSKDGFEGTRDFALKVMARPPSDEQAVIAAKNALQEIGILGGNTSQDSIISNLSLPLSGSYDTSISWASSDLDFVSESGVVSRPAYSIGNQLITLVATIAKGSASEIAEFELTLLSRAIIAEEAIAIELEKLTTDQILEFISKGLFPIFGENDTYLTWNSSDSAIQIGEDGAATINVILGSSKSVTLQATVSKGDKQSTISFRIEWSGWNFSVVIDD